jgi:hypothetical protein
MVERKGAYKVFMGKPKGNRPFENPRLRRDCNIKIDISRKWDVGFWTGSRWMKIGTGGEHL